MVEYLFKFWMCYRGYILRLSNRNFSLIILFKIPKKNFSKMTFTICWFRARAQRAASRGLFPNVGRQLGSTLLSLMFNYPCIWGAPRRATSPEFTLRPLFLLLDDRPGRAGSYRQLIRTAGALLRRRGVDCARNGQRFLVPWKAECQLGAADTSSSPKQRELLAEKVTPRFCFGKRSEFKMSSCTLVQELYTLRDALCNHTFPMIFCERSSYPMTGTHGVVL